MLHVNVEVAYAACESVDSTSANSAEASHHHEEASTADGVGDDRTDPDAPSAPPLCGACCQAMASCGTSIIVERDDASMTGLSALALAVGPPGEIPLDRNQAPEPPPPKV